MITEKRQEVQNILDGNNEGLVAIVGPCANHKSRQIINEGRKLDKLNDGHLVTVHRQPHWKPRTPVPNGPKPWEGIEDTNYEAALSRMTWAARRGISVATELGKDEHIERYADLVVFAWLGARSLDSHSFTHLIGAGLDTELPLGVKNDLTGDIASALRNISLINKERANRGSNTSATLVFRGGSDFQTPLTWEDQYRKIFDVTEGRFIVDIAHGSEMAHDPNDQFKKTVIGQIACMEHVIRLASEGLVPRGIMIEASDYINPDKRKQTDPNMPFNIALEGIVELSKEAR